jgi:peptidoglycan lytic transglycosylase B
MTRISRKILSVAGILLALAAPAATQAEEKKPFGLWLEDLKQEALAKGIEKNIVDEAFANVKFKKKIVSLDRKQPEVTQTFQQYMSNRLPQSLVNQGRSHLNTHREVLEKIGREYGVQPRFIVALWGVETRFGKYTGGFNVVEALTTLAYDNRRADYFRGELMTALRILNEKHITVKNMKGSWAGAMGQAQFMPSSFINFSVDYDGDGRRDIWKTKPDVFASAANYLSKSGWRYDQTWGREVKLPKGFDVSLASLKIKKPMADWQAMGVRKISGADLPNRQLMGSLVQPKGGNGQTFLVYNNYRTILKWNRSTYFAMSVGHLADRIGN